MAMHMNRSVTLYSAQRCSAVEGEEGDPFNPERMKRQGKSWIFQKIKLKIPQVQNEPKEDPVLGFPCWKNSTLEALNDTSMPQDVQHQEKLANFTESAACVSLQVVTALLRQHL